MQYGHFDNVNREYVIDRVDLPVSWTNYIGTGDMMGVFNHTAGGYLIYKSSEYHRITRFRPNGVPMDGPGHYVYLRDEEDGGETPPAPAKKTWVVTIPGLSREQAETLAGSYPGASMEEGFG